MARRSRDTRRVRDRSAGLCCRRRSSPGRRRSCNPRRSDDTRASRRARSDRSCTGRSSIRRYRRSCRRLFRKCPLRTSLRCRPASSSPARAGMLRRRVCNSRGRRGWSCRELARTPHCSIDRGSCTQHRPRRTPREGTRCFHSARSSNRASMRTSRRDHDTIASQRRDSRHLRRVSLRRGSSRLTSRRHRHARGRPAPLLHDRTRRRAARRAMPEPVRAKRRVSKDARREAETCEGLDGLELQHRRRLDEVTLITKEPGDADIQSEPHRARREHIERDRGIDGAIEA
jgi:hypothetical protein